MAITHVSDANFSKSVEGGGTVLVDFWASWCGPCKMIAPVLEEIDKEIGSKVKIVKVDVDANQASPKKYGVMGIPTLLLFKNGKVVEKIVGYKAKEELMSTLKKHI